MNGINEVLLLGTVGADPETKLLNENSRVTTFRLATNENFTDKTGNKRENTEWHFIECWNFLSDNVSNYVKKGNHLIVRGKIKTDAYDDRENAGKKLYKTKIVADNIHFLPGNKKESQNQQQPMQQYQQPVQQQSMQQQPMQQYQQPVQQQPMQQQPMQQQPMQQQPMQQQPMQQQPMQQYQQPVQQQPMQQYQQPIQQQPMQQYQQPIQQQQPVQQNVQNNQVEQYMTGQKFVEDMNSPDDLPF